MVEVPLNQAILYCWLLEVNATSSGSANSVTRVPEVPSSVPPVSLDLPKSRTASTFRLQISDRGWIGEPNDPDAPNEVYPPRLASAPAIVREIPIYPDAERRVAANEVECSILNQDGLLNSIIGDWRIAGLQAVLYRGIVRSPKSIQKNSFVRIGEFRLLAPPTTSKGTATLALTNLGADLSTQVCSQLGGTGGIDGAADLKGQNKPRLYGFVRNINPILIDSAKLIYLINDGPISQVVAARDRGALLTNGGNVASYSDLNTTNVANGTYKTCLATGHIRLGLQATSLTLDARGDTTQGGYTGTAARIAIQLLRGAGGISETRSLEASFSSWPTYECGILIKDGSVEEALNRLSRGIIAYWGSDNFGNFTGGRIMSPDSMVPVLALDPSTLIGPPEAAEQPRAPWWRAAVGYQNLDIVQTGSNVLVGSVSAADQSYYGLQARTAYSAINFSNRTSYPLAEDGVVPEAILDKEGDAVALATFAMDCFGQQRQTWSCRLEEATLLKIREGQCVTIQWPGIAGLEDPKKVIVRQSVMDDGFAEILVWG